MWAWIVKISILSNECFARTSVFNAFFLPSYHSCSYQLIAVWPVRHGSGRIQKNFGLWKKPSKSANPLRVGFLFISPDTIVANLRTWHRVHNYRRLLFRAISLEYTNSTRGQRTTENPRQQPTTLWESKLSADLWKPSVFRLTTI